MRIKLTFILFLLPPLAFRQTLKLISAFEIQQQPVAVSIDRTGRLYLGLSNGEIERYDTEGNLEYNNSTNRRFPITLIEAWQGLKTFVYSSAYQEYFFLDRFFNNSEFYRVEGNEFRTFDGLATLENDQTLWAFNTETQTLRKVDLYNNELLFDNQLNLTLNIEDISPEHMRVYQNLVFISEKDDGIAVFDKLGGFLDFIPKKGISYFSFLNDEIILYDGNTLELVNIYTKKKRVVPIGNYSFDFVLMEKDQLIGIKGKRIERFQIN